jgi:hypothetical protein
MAKAQITPAIYQFLVGVYHFYPLINTCRTILLHMSIKVYLALLEAAQQQY